MSDQVTGETPTTATETGATTAAQTQTETASVEERIQQAVEAATKKANAEALKFRKQIEALEQADKAKQEAELSETEKLKRDLAAAQAQLKAAQIDNMKRTIAAAVGLPAPLAARLQGDDEETLKADAMALLESLPKADTKKPTLPVTNPGNNAGGGDTEAQRRAKIYSPGGNLFDPATAQKIGGGVFVLDKNSQGE